MSSELSQLTASQRDLLLVLRLEGGGEMRVCELPKALTLRSAGLLSVPISTAGRTVKSLAALGLCTLTKAELPRDGDTIVLTPAGERVSATLAAAYRALEGP